MQIFVSRDVNVSTITIAANHPFAKLITLANRKLPTSLNIKANESDST